MNNTQVNSLLQRPRLSSLLHETPQSGTHPLTSVPKQLHQVPQLLAVPLHLLHMSLQVLLVPAHHYLLVTHEAVEHSISHLFGLSRDNNGTGRGREWVLMGRKVLLKGVIVSEPGLTERTGYHD